MIQEYLFVGNENRDEIEKYTYKEVRAEISEIENSGCWVATFESGGDDADSAKTLSVIHEYVVSNFNPTVLSNGCSAYYNRRLYPHFNEFERKLRKLLYLKSALSKDEKDSETIKDIERLDFGKIFELLFSDTQFVQDARKTVKEKTWQFTKSEILDALQKIAENTLWDRLVGENAVSQLRSEFTKIKDYRNDIMHAHSMNTSSYLAALKLIERTNEQLDVEIGKIIGAREKDISTSEDNSFNTTIGDAIRNMEAANPLKLIQERLSEMQANITPIRFEVPESILEYQRMLETIKPDPALIESLRKIQELLGETKNGQDEI